MSYSPPKIYLGEIVDVQDPLKEGRAKIRVFGLFDGLEPDDIPWASQVTFVSFSGKGKWETNPDLLEEISDSCEGAHSLIYDSNATPGPLKIFYTQKKGLNLILGDAKVQLDTQDGGQLRVVIEMGEDQIRMENNKVIINSSNIELGEAAVEAVIKGNTFQTFFNSHTHIGNLGGPTSPPIIPSDPTHLSNVSKTR